MPGVVVSGRVVGSGGPGPAEESPVSGSIWQLAVAPGDRVQAGDTLLIIESMKMEIAVQALEAGTIVSIQREPGQQVKAGQCLLVLEVE